MRAGPFICLSAFLWASCSVKEARQDCPCRLEVDLTAFGEVTRQVSLDLDGKALERSLLGPDSLLVRTRVAASDFLDIRVWSGVSRMEARGSLLQVKEGNDGDSLFLFCSRLPGRRESALVKAVPHKQFATVVLQVLPEDLPAGVRFTVRGQYGSFDLDGGQPVAAPLVIPLPEGKAESAFRLPRQEAAGVLVLEEDDGKGNLRSYPLGEWILAAGYDWNAPDLDDILVAVDFVMNSFQVQVSPWIPGEKMEHLL